jgi:hypothetical protein
MGNFLKIGGFFKKVGGWIYDHPWYTLGIIILGIVICFYFC